MNCHKIIKLLFSVFLLFLIVPYLQAQKNRKPLQILPSIGMRIQFLDKDIYSGKPLNFSQQFGLALQKNISNKIFIGIETQYGQYNLKDNVLQTYQRFITSSSLQSFSPSTIINGIVNIGYAKKTKKGGGETGMALGAGMQRLTATGNSLQIPNPFNGNRLAYVYRENEGKYSNPLLQLSLTETFYVKPCIGFTAGIKIQYVRNLQTTVYKPLPTDTNAQAALKNLFISPDVVSKANWQLTVIPSIGIHYVFGACRGPKAPKKPQAQKDPQQQTTSCFGLQWKNNVPKDSCFRGDSLQFALTQKHGVPGALAYEIYIAPVNDLNNQQLLYSLPYPSSKFTINPVLMDANKEYAIIVKLKNGKKENECLQYIMPVKRCADCCKDVKLRR